MHRSLSRVLLFLAAAFAVPFVSLPLAAQEPGNVPETKAPAPVQAAPATPPVVAAPSPTEYNAKLDWPWLARFKEADVAMAPPAAGENRVVFMGDSITQAWKIEGPDGFFPGKPYINRGISGQTTPQMLLRFRQDVIDLKPKVVIILAGTNDIAGNTGPETLDEIEGYIASMAELAASDHIRVVLCSILPAFDYPWKPGMEPAPKIDEVNRWMKSFADDHGYIYVDYHSAMKDEKDGLPSALSYDGVHPTAAGYTVMAPLAQAGIEKALKAGNRE
jgi:lysophospholipase L1-like esterase